MDRPLRIYPILESAPKRSNPPSPSNEGQVRRPAPVRAQRLKAEAENATVCQIRNVRVGSRRTTLRLESAFWDAFDALCDRESATVDSVLTDLEGERRDEALTSMVRSYLVAYWRRRAGSA